jgi:hypothetical protein
VQHLRFYPRINTLPHVLRHRLPGQGVGQAGEAFLPLRQFHAEYEAPAIVLNLLMGVVRVAGKIGISSLYVTEDPGAVDAAAKLFSAA